MTAIRSYIHSIITHIAIDWMGPVFMWSQNRMLFTVLTPCVGVLEDVEIRLLHWFLWKMFENGAIFTVQMYLLHYNDRIQKAYQSRKANECPELIIFKIDSSHRLYMKNSEPVRLCYYTMEMRPFPHLFDNEMTSIRSYFHSIRHTATDWLCAFRVISKRNAVDA